MNKWLKISLIVLGLLAYGGIVWFALPLIPWGETYPFEGFWLRFWLIAIIFIIAGGVYGFRFWKRRKAAKALEQALKADEAQSGDGVVLSGRMSEAIETLKRSSGKQSFLYELPWYVIIGPPGAGKTTALVNSGLKFPLAGAGGAAAVAGVGGTRYCDWWFTEDAVLIDTAGRYTTQDSDSETDKKSWSAFLSLLKDHRPKQPINGVILAISLEDVVSLGNDELNAHTNAIRKRLLELHQELKIDFPVYALFTKADLIQGFREYFGNFTESRRRKVWGATFQTEDRTKNLVGQVPEEFDALIRRLTEELPDRLHEEPDPIARIAIFGFPGQFATLRDRVGEFLNRIFEPTRYQTNANLRGFYFSSGTQEGTPIDQVLGAMGKNFGGNAAQHFSGSGKSFFLYDLLKNVIFAESGWVSFDRKAVRRAAIVNYGAMSIIGLVSVGLLGVWGWSYINNKAIITAAENTMSEYRVIADEELKRDTISDTDIHTVLGNLHTLRNMQVGYSNRDQSVPLGETFGLSQRERLVSASETSYRAALERMLRSRLILRLERQIEASLNDPEVVYTALKVYLMLGGKAPAVDKSLIVAYMRQDWEDNLFPGAANADGRRAMLEHLEAMLDLDRGRAPSFELNGPLVESAQRALARMQIADRAYSLIQAAASATSIEDYSVVSQGGADTALVFETVDGSPIEELQIPGLYSYNGFHGFFLAQLGDVAQTLVDDQWVMGDLGQQSGVEQQFGRLGPELLDRYRRDFIAAWEKVLSNIKFKPMSADKPQYIALAAASSPTSPIRQLFESIRTETMLTEEPEGGLPESVADVVDGANKGTALEQASNLAIQRFRDRQSAFARIGIDLAIKKSQRRAGEIGQGGGGGGQAQIPGANIEAYFKPYHILVEGEAGRRPIDALVQNFYDVYQNLVLSATNPSQAERANANLQVAVVNLRANASRIPKTVAVMVETAVNDFEGDAADTSIAQLNQMLTGTVTRVCQQVIENRYPFSRGSGRDVPLADFARLFAPNGTLDRFFAQNLASLADISAKVWTWKDETRLGREFSKATLREFQRAAEIRDAFFPTGGAMPGVQLTITPNTLSGDAEMALLDVNGTVLQTQQGAGNPPVTFLWPGSGGSGTTTVSVLPEIVGREPSKSKTGAWSLMRMIDEGGVSRQDDDILTRFVVGGREVSYKIQVGAVANPFFLPALSEFKCPTGL